MLSPCIRQVTHALLTRPPLTGKSLGFITCPFDLHVLSTPPAFILSQDQTLIINGCLSCQSYLALLFLVRSVKTSLFFRPCSLNNSLGIFRVALLFICQRTICWRFIELNDSLFTIAHLYSSVNNFFEVFLLLFCCPVFLSNEIEYITPISTCQH